ncbi:SMC-Scp complex subunit ScpB [Halomonas vilamensis]|uniref:SMC-Scp complex subunit ScpB n=1 Tax=Vreelandella vilamensis TaxID=531309 RepID=A0ABU1GZK7_9GAMM|nr:SMC-Scp complex subunit ScpB [Halomonas vilamensis]MDR5897468.1 SMC-Scp complex subunit ScpB [Halomonas vilamensis]
MSDNGATTLDDILEAGLLAAGEPLALERLETLFRDAECPPRSDIKQSLLRLERRHANGALELIETVSGYQLRIRPRLSPWVSRLWDERPQRYSRALLETLALIAYRQPVTRGDIEEVRGVSVSSSIVRTLMERGWIRVVGHRDVPGRPAVYATTRGFLDDFGLKTLDALPPMHALTAAATADDESPDTSAAEFPLDADDKTGQDAPLETVEKADPHAETALNSPLSFADLEARLAARAQRGNEPERTSTEEKPDEHESGK